jgi:hypothetical protein
MKSSRLIAILALCSLAYLGAYVTLYLNKSPSGNLQYFVYLSGGEKNAKAEHILYNLFYPIHLVHERCGGVPHIYERRRPSFPKDFNG